MGDRRALILLVVLALGLALIVPAAHSAMLGQSSTGDDDRWSDYEPIDPSVGDESGDTDSDPSGEQDGGGDAVEGDVVEGDVAQRTVAPKIQIRFYLVPPMIYFVIR